jgi:Ser/Thr protein kinase RdoA (MazF antagonist)
MTVVARGARSAQMMHSSDDPRSDLVRALDAWGVGVRRHARIAPSTSELGNQAWHVWTREGRHLVARRYTPFRSRAEVAYELEVLRHLGQLGWSVPIPVAGVIDVGGRRYSLCAYVAGGRCDDSPESARRRGALLAALHAALLPVRDRLGQRPDWRAQPVLDDPRFESDRLEGLDRLRSEHRALAEEIDQASTAARAELRGLGLDGLPRFVLHGDFTTGNVRQRRGRPCGAIDFDLCHVGCRPWELVIARLQRAPALLDGYRREAARLGIPLSAEEERVLPAVNRSFRAGMIGWALVEGARLGVVDADFIRVQLQKLRLGLAAGTPWRTSPPLP